MSDLFEMTGQDIVDAPSEGYWHIGKMRRLPDLQLTDAAGGSVALVKNRLLSLRSYIGGSTPQHQSVYSHNVTAQGGQTKQFGMIFELKNFGGGTLKVFEVSDHVACEDNARHAYWTETISATEYENITRATATLSNEGIWESCS